MTGSTIGTATSILWSKFLTIQSALEINTFWLPLLLKIITLACSKYWSTILMAFILPAFFSFVRLSVRIPLMIKFTFTPAFTALYKASNKIVSVNEFNLTVIEAT